MFSKRFAVFTFVSAVGAHGTVSGIVADGIYYNGYNPSYQYISPAPVTVGWLIPQDLDNGFVAPSAYASSDIICHKAATPAQIEAPSPQEERLSFNGHHGPYLTKDLSSITLPTAMVGMISPTSQTSGYWGTDVLIANNNSWTVKIPSNIATGNYVLRHEIIALHAAGSANGAQNYPQCVSLAIKGTGTTNPAGVSATTFYTPTDPGILFDIYGTLTNYTIPGPALYSGAATVTQTLPGPPTATASGIYTVS
ncbi:hypothetical protein DID88_004605 [Monilinia fructigena]|uniref:Auxiliary Activity family 9 catalytic domain-containing protein n=1 Tax=Monilinia fructigena TaxID=38457 RepID=A0A395ITN4_9HELO|nr:hypothetical protein DID88_004605 [Monilinia fructigena]